MSWILSRNGRASAAAVSVALCAPAIAHADEPARAPAEPAPAEIQEANLRFQEGKALVEQGAIAEGCEKLAQSLALARRGGTLLNLAACRQKQGRHATALKLFQEALDAATADRNRERAEIALRGLSETRAQLSWLVITIAPGAGAPGLRVMLDGTPLAASALGTMIAVDPGPHAIAAEAPGRRRFDLTVTSGPAGDRRAVEVPALAAEAPAAPHADAPAPKAVPAQPEAADRSVGPLIAGISLLGAGAVVTVTGAVFGTIAIVDSAASRRLCPKDVCTNQTGIDKNDSARNAANLSNILLPVGLGAAAAGALVLILRPGAKPRAPAARVSPMLHAGPSGAWITLEGSF